MAKGDGIIAGTAMVDHLIQIWAPSVQINLCASDGVPNGEEIANLTGCRETIVNRKKCIEYPCTYLGRYEKTKNGQGHKTDCLYRKTTWGLLDKWAVHLGGGLTHRLTRKDALMIKETIGINGVLIVMTKIAEPYHFTDLTNCNHSLRLKCASVWRLLLWLQFGNKPMKIRDKPDNVR